MAYKHHEASYTLGERELKPEERIIVSTRKGPKEPRRVARHLGVSELQPKVMIDHRHWSDGEYLPTFNTKKCVEREEFSRYLENYQTEEGNRIWGEGLKGRTVYIVHTFDNQYDLQALDKMNEFIAWTAKYNGAEAVVLLAYTLTHSAQERGVHHEHPRMESEEAKYKFDGQSPLSQLQLKQYATSGIDVIINPHNHCSKETNDLCNEVNNELKPMHEASLVKNSTLRYQVQFVDVDLSPMVGMFISDYGKTNLDFDTSNHGENILFMGPDKGIIDFVKRVREKSGLTNSALAAMNKCRADDGSNVDLLELVLSEGLTAERGIEGMDVVLIDDSIRSGGTMRKNTEVLMGMNVEGIVRDPKIKGTPRRVAVYSTRTNFAGNSRDILYSPAINDIVITNSDPRGIMNLGELDSKTQMLWINFIMGEAARAVECGKDPNTILTPDYIRSNQLLKIDIPHGHQRFIDPSLRTSGII